MRTDRRPRHAGGGAPACGRAYPRIRAIEGRWHGERLFGDGGRVFSMTALNTHSAVFDRVARFRIRQERAGEAIVFVVPGAGYGEADRRAVQDEYDMRAAALCASPSSRSTTCPDRARKFKFIEQLIPEGPEGS